MTINQQAIGRSAASRRPTQGFLLAAMLLLGAPGLAQASSLATDSADALAPALQSVSAPAPVLNTQDQLLFASDVEQLIANQEFSSQRAAPSGRIQSLLQRALALLGTPYRWGGSSTNGFDCSGLVGYVFRTALGIELPRVSQEMAHTGQSVDRSALNAGDLVFFSRTGRRVDHVGIYMGDGQFLHAPRTGKDVTVSRLDTGYWSSKFMQARRVGI